MAATTIEVQGSWGVLVVDKATGLIVAAEHEELSATDIAAGYNGYRDIAMFELASIEREGDTDILWTGYWTIDGVFEPALTDRKVLDGGVMELDVMVPLALLPAPAAEIVA